jgi:hypothetical protein
MLHDPSKEPGTLQHFVSWLERQDPNTTYEFVCPNGCLVATYVNDCGLSRENDLSREVRLVFTGGDRRAIAAARPRTYGDALDRAREAIAEGWTALAP